MKTLVTVGGEYFGVEGIGKGGAGGSDGDVYFFKLTDLVKDRGAIRVSLFVSGASRACVPDFNARLETACLNALRRGFDSGDFSFDAKDQYRELKPKAVDFRPQKKASDLMIRRFIAVCAYHLWIEHSQNGLTPYVDFDYAEDLDYLGATAADVGRNVRLLAEEGALRYSPAATPASSLRVEPTAILIRQIERGDFLAALPGSASAMTSEITTNQGKALRLLKAIYDSTRSSTAPVSISDVHTGLPEEDLKAAWRYLKDRGLIDTFNVPYTARINGAGVDAIENAERHPDRPSSNFPSATHNVVYNTMNVGTISNSPIQQAGVHSAQSQTATYGANDLDEMRRLVTEFRLHLSELRLDGRQEQRAQAQIATLEAQLTDDPDSVIIRQAGRTLRSITEGAIGALAAAAAQPIIWTWVGEAMRRLFG
jgi:hypothetical protein